MSFDWQTDDREWDERETRRSGRRPADLPPLNEALFGGPEPAAAPVAPPRRARRPPFPAVGLAPIHTWPCPRAI